MCTIMLEESLYIIHFPAKDCLEILRRASLSANASVSFGAFYPNLIDKTIAHNHHFAKPPPILPGPGFPFVAHPLITRKVCVGCFKWTKLLSLGCPHSIDAS